MTSISQNLKSQWDQTAAASPAVKQATPAISEAVSFAAAATPAPAIHDQTQIQAKATRSQAQVAFIDQSTPISKLDQIDSPGVFFDGNAATGAELDAVLRRYGSPHAGQGELIAKTAREQKINPILLLAVMQQESSYGNVKNNKLLKAENIANPWSVHFNESAQGIKKLRLKNDEMPSFQQSLDGAVRTLKNLAGDDPKPLSHAGEKYSTTGSWTQSVTNAYQTQLGRIAKMR